MPVWRVWLQNLRCFALKMYNSTSGNSFSNNSSVFTGVAEGSGYKPRVSHPRCCVRTIHMHLMSLGFVILHPCFYTQHMIWLTLFSSSGSALRPLDHVQYTLTWKIVFIRGFGTQGGCFEVWFCNKSCINSVVQMLNTYLWSFCFIRDPHYSSLDNVLP